MLISPSLTKPDAKTSQWTGTFRTALVSGERQRQSNERSSICLVWSLVVQAGRKTCGQNVSLPTHSRTNGTHCFSNLGRATAMSDAKAYLLSRRRTEHGLYRR